MNELPSLFNHYEYSVVENSKRKLEVECLGSLTANDAKKLINDGWVVSADRRSAVFLKRVEPEPVSLVDLDLSEFDEVDED
jgi:hypothetical protein